MNKHKPRWLVGLVLLVTIMSVVGLASRPSLVAPAEITFSVGPRRTSMINILGCQHCSDKTTKPYNTTGKHNLTGANDSPSITTAESESCDGYKTAHPEAYVAQWRNGSLTLEQAVNYITCYMKDIS